jgi:hypothetical protein
MGSSARKRQTFAKMTRERAVQEKRELKRQRKAERKAAAAAEAAGETVDTDNPETPPPADE